MNGFDLGDFTITKREILMSVSIIALMLLIGFLISGKIQESQLDKNEKYNKALKIEDSEMFEYGMRTNIGNAFIYGELKAVDTVTYPEIGGEYMYVKKVEEHYRKHTRQVRHTRTVNGKITTYYTTEVYWSWDRVGSEDLKCKEISFLGVVFDINKIDIPGTVYIDTIKEWSHVRFKYYGVPTKHVGTIFTELKDDTISNNTSFYKDMTIEDTVKHLEFGFGTIFFWIFWIILMCIIVFAFYYFDNRWLD